MHLLPPTPRAEQIAQRAEGRTERKPRPGSERSPGPLTCGIEEWRIGVITASGAGSCCRRFPLSGLGGEVDHRTDLDRAGPSGWDFGRDLNGVVQILRLDQIKAAQLFLGFGKRPISGRD